MELATVSQDIPNDRTTHRSRPLLEPVVIEPTKTWVSLHLHDVWVHRELLYFLIWRDLKVRYKQTIFGVTWVALQPLLMTMVFTMVLGRLVRLPSNGIPYAVFAYAGLMIWIFFSGAISITSNCLVGNAHLITKVYFPRLIIPIASIAARVVDLLVSFAIMFVLLLLYRIPLSSQMLMVPAIILLVSLFALAFGLWTSAVNVKYRDVGLVLPVLIQLWMFVSPIVYPLQSIPAKWRLVYSLNPIAGIVENFRASLFGYAFDWPSLAIAAGVTLTLLVYAAYAFQAREKTFADIV
jgi:lipopolysaccharide transport system permease protein